MKKSSTNKKVKPTSIKSKKIVKKTIKKTVKIPAYDHLKVEKKQQKAWLKKPIYKASDTSLKKKFYGLVEFPFPSGAGLHTGHIRSYAAPDIVSRKRRMEGYNVLFPMGWDAFGLPTENYAIKTGIPPQKVTQQNTANFRRQMDDLGLSFDWSREINTTDPNYYKWTQWIFLQMFKKGLAYKKMMTINWCPKDKVGLANEEVVNGCCERCGTPVEKRDKDQWMLAITKYADRLDKDLDTVDYWEKIKIQQRNWIGRSEGVNLKCNIKHLDIKVEMYDSVPQTYTAQTFTVIAPEHPLVKTLVKGTEHEKAVLKFVDEIVKKKAANKFDVENDMEGIFTGRYIENFAGTGRDLPIWIASFVLADYGTGIVNASAHDTRDYAFAKKYNIPLHEVLEPLVTKETGDDAFRHDMPVSERNAVVAVIKHWSEDKYLGARWKKTGWQGFVIGGIEKGEEAKDAGLREVLEETGYKNAEFTQTLGGTIHARFYQMVKKENRLAHFQPVLYTLKNEERIETNKEEKDLHEFVWYTKEEMRKFITHPDMHIVWDRVVGEEKPIIKNGILKEPEQFKGREWNEVRKDVIDYLVEKGYATRKVNYKLRDWVFSRQRYWGEPIPLVYCEHCKTAENNGWIAIPEKDLPLVLPPVKNYKPSEDGESPLATMEKWIKTKCPQCKGPARRETDTMPQWAGSSWYYLRYTDPKNKKEFASQKNIKKWMQVDWYNGGMEHTTLHLLYSRFWHKFLYDIGQVNTIEPYAKRTSQGLILAEGGSKMSKSKGNVVNPDDLIKTFGADTLRVYEMFIGPFDQPASWSSDNMIGSRRFIERVWNMAGSIIQAGKIKITKNPDFAELESALQKTIKKVSDDIENMGFNTAVSSLMIMLNTLETYQKGSEEGRTVPRDVFESFLKLLAPFAPFVTDELWTMLGHKQSIHTESWPKYDAKKIVATAFTIVVQINGKVRDTFSSVSDEESEVTSAALKLQKIVAIVGNQTPKKVIYVKGRLVSIVL